MQPNCSRPFKSFGDIQRFGNIHIKVGESNTESLLAHYKMGITSRNERKQSVGQKDRQKDSKMREAKAKSGREEMQGNKRRMRQYNEERKRT